MSISPLTPELLRTELNPVQYEAVMHGSGPMLILAGAGSGKTRVLTYRVAWLIEQGARPGEIMAVTFTNKAAAEMRERIARLVPHAVSPRPYSGAWIGTFHALCARILRQDGAAAGIPRDFVVFDDVEQIGVVKEAMNACSYSPEVHKPRQILNAISRAKEGLQSPAEFSRAARSPFNEMVARIYSEYQRLLALNHGFDFDDLLLAAVKLLREHEDVRSAYQERFRHILVDEYQDINKAQYEFVHTLSAQHRNLVVVGDDDQSIYAWRGADVGFILAFEKDYADARVVRLEQNYRSTQTILDAAYGVVRRNSGRHEKRLWTENGTGEPIQVHSAEDELAEARYVGDVIETVVRTTGIRYGDVAVLYRTNAQSRVLEDTLKRRRLPYRLIGGVRFYDRKEVRDLIAYLRLVLNPNDTYSLQRVINAPARSIGDRSIERLRNFADEHDISLFGAISRAGDVEGLTPRARAALGEFTRVIRSAAELSASNSIARILRYVVDESRYLEALREDRSPEAVARAENVQEMVNVANEFDEQVGGSLADFLEQMALVSDVDSLRADNEGVVLMTLHAAKGLEFSLVLMCGLEEDLFPHTRSLEDPAQLEEERRLCYVGMTRARRWLHLTYARRRMVFGAPRFLARSRFLRELPEQVVRLSGHSPSERGRYRDVDESAFARAEPTAPTRAPAGPVPNQGLSPAARRMLEDQSRRGAGQYQKGDRVRHAIFGDGIVTRSIGSGDDEEVTVVFPGHGDKKLISGYARLIKLD